MSDDELGRLRRGGHDPVKVYNAFVRAINHTGQPTVILAKTVKGYGLGDAGEGRNVTHQQKKMDLAELKAFRDRFQVPVPDEGIAEVPFYRRGGQHRDPVHERAARGAQRLYPATPAQVDVTRSAGARGV